ncbi:MAG: putative DNA modification/repair radical SAM protein [Firmicutes bacterium HGW-Firmicutes-15]|nr:MAG: putative DNA modification/repair radical SAM protein [Firmicutes bacterium HGW-Firmicutes-15]
MDIMDKLKILADAAKYDVSCSSSGSRRTNKPGGLGNSAPSGICHSWSDDGRCISLLKILQTNYCVYNCSYCVNRVSNDVPRAFLSPDEICDLTMNFYRRNYIEGLFLSTAISSNPDQTMEMLLQTVMKIREEHCFNGYIHLKAIPGADNRLIEAAGKYVDRMSINMELPSEQGLRLLAPQKKRAAIVKPMSFMSTQITAQQEERRKSRKAPLFLPAGQTTQMIVGATPDHDWDILKLSEKMYRQFHLKRVYYSAYVPVARNPNLPDLTKPPLLREHRLYQADWLLRFYGFNAQELLNETHPNFAEDYDPKTDWALRNLHYFPVEVNRADYEMLLRVPGIGVKSAKRILTARRMHSLRIEDLKLIGIVLKRAQYFITCGGKYSGQTAMEEYLLRPRLALSQPKSKQAENRGCEQLSLFSFLPEPVSPEIALSSITGEF